MPEDTFPGVRSRGGIVCLLAAAVLVACPAAFAQVQANPFFDDSAVHVINLTMAPADWAALQQNYLLDTYYPATFVWNGISESIGIRSRGKGSRSPVKPNFDLNFAYYQKAQTLLGLPFVTLKANNEDPSNLREWVSMKLFRKMGIPAPREAPAQVLLNGQILGFYYIVEHIDATFLQRNFGDSAGYLYDWQSPEGGPSYDFQNLGTDPNLYAQFLDLKSSQPAPDLQTFADLVQIINQPASASFTDAAFISAVSNYVDPKQFLTYGATEQVLSGSDSLIGGQQGMNNFDLYQFTGTTQYYFIPWDKDLTFTDAARDLFFGISIGPNINLLAARLAGIPQYLQVYLNAAVRAANLMGATGGWADLELNREYDVIHAAALNDPNRPCFGDMLTICGNPDFEAGVEGLHQILVTRSSFVLSEAVGAGWQPSTAGPQLTGSGITALGGARELSPGGVSYVQGKSLAVSAQATFSPMPRVLGNAYVAVDGVRAPLFNTADSIVEFQLPGDLPVGISSIVVSFNGDMSQTFDMDVQASTPAILAAVKADGSPLTAAGAAPGQNITLYATGLGAVNGNLPIGAAEPFAPALTTTALPVVTFGDVSLTVTFAGLSPGFVGLYQVNATIPSASGNAAVSGVIVLTIDGQAAGWRPQ